MFPVKSLVEEAKKKNKKPVNKKGFESRSQEENIRNMLETESKLVYK
jgi:hypothetical protein